MSVVPVVHVRDTFEPTGKSLAQATRACVLKHGDAHLAYLAAFNAGVPRE